MTLGYTELRTRNRKMFLGTRARPVCRADNQTDICEPIILDISQAYKHPRPVTGIALLYGDGVCFL
jgi:hypothetical protein